MRRYWGISLTWLDQRIRMDAQQHVPPRCNLIEQLYLCQGTNGFHLTRCAALCRRIRTLTKQRGLTIVTGIRCAGCLHRTVRTGVGLPGYSTLLNYRSP